MRHIALLLLLTLPSWGALNSTVAWDVRTTGSTSNAGGFDSSVGSPGTDFSQQDSPQVSYTDLIIGVTTTQYTSVLNPVGNTLPGNTILITAGSGCTTGTYEILSNSTITATVDRSMGTAASVCTAALGGAKAHICSTFSGANCTGGALQAAVSGNTIWVKAGTYSTATTLQNSNAAGTNVTIVYDGYKTTHGDITPSANLSSRPLITTATNSVGVFTVVGGSLVTFRNISCSVTAATPNPCVIDNSGISIFVYNCKFSNSATTGGYGISFFSAPGNIEGVIVASEFDLNSTANGIGDQSGNNGQLIVMWCYFHGGANGIYDVNAGNNQRWLIRNSTFSGMGRGVYQQGTGGFWVELVGNSFYNSTNEDVKIGTTTLKWMTATNNAFYGGTIGISVGATPTTAFSLNNAFGNMGTSNYSNFPAGFDSSDIALSANPFTNTGTGDFSPNNTAGGGAALKAAGYPGVSSFGTGYVTIGALDPSQAVAAAGAPRACVQ